MFVTFSKVSDSCLILAYVVLVRYLALVQSLKEDRPARGTWRGMRLPGIIDGPTPEEGTTVLSNNTSIVDQGRQLD